MMVEKSHLPRRLNKERMWPTTTSMGALSLNSDYKVLNQAIIGRSPSWEGEGGGRVGVGVEGRRNDDDDDERGLTQHGQGGPEEKKASGRGADWSNSHTHIVVSIAIECPVPVSIILRKVKVPYQKRPSTQGWGGGAFR